MWIFLQNNIIFYEAAQTLTVVNLLFCMYINREATFKTSDLPLLKMSLLFPLTHTVPHSTSD